MRNHFKKMSNDGLIGNIQRMVAKSLYLYGIRETKKIHAKTGEIQGYKITPDELKKIH